MANDTGDRPGELDLPCIVRGAWRGFVVLLLGGLVAPGLAAITPFVAWFALTAVAVTAFVVAACGVGHLGRPVRHGVYAAVGAYGLVLPLVILSATGRDPAQIAAATATAVAVGALTGFLAGRRHDRARERRRASSVPARR